MAGDGLAALGERPTAASFARDFGRTSTVYRDARERLRQKLHELRRHPRLAAAKRAWFDALPAADLNAGGRGETDDDLFATHTYLAILARLLVWSAFERRCLASGEVTDVLEGRYFQDKRIANLVEGDLFGWPAIASATDATPVWLDLARRLAGIDLGAVREDVLRPVYEQLVDAGRRHDLGEHYTPDWLASLLVRRLLGGAGAGATPSVLDPACGSGTFLRATIELVRERCSGLPAPGLLKLLLSKVTGFDVHPLAVLVARATCVLAVQDLVRHATGPLAIPVFLADPLQQRGRSQADYVVGNPPWLTFGRIVASGSKERVLELARRTGVTSRRPGEQSHTELATIFLAFAAENLLRHDPAGVGARLAFLMPRSVLTALHHARFRQGSHRTRFDVEEIWDLADVGPLFNVPACALFVSLEDPKPRAPKPGLVLSGRLPEKDLPWEEAQRYVSCRPVTWELAFLGRRSAWRIAGNGAASRGAAGRLGYYSGRFRQGAILYPQTLLVVLPETAPSPDLGELRVATDSDAAREAKKCRDAQVDHRVDTASLHLTAAGDHILPYTLEEKLWTVVLPALTRPGHGCFETVDADTLRRHGRIHTAAWLDWAEEQWARSRKRDDATPLWRRLDYMGQLSGQAERHRYLVLYTAAGTRPVAAFVDTEAFPRPFVARDRTFWASFADPEEAHYLVAFLNSDFAAAAILDWMNRGLFGPRDINKRVLDVPLPPYSGGRAEHRALAAVAAELGGQALAARTKLTSHSRGRRRTELRSLLDATLLAEVEALTAEISAAAARG